MENYGLRESVDTGKLKNSLNVEFIQDVICISIKQFILANEKYLSIEQLLYLYKVLYFNC